MAEEMTNTTATDTANEAAGAEEQQPKTYTFDEVQALLQSETDKRVTAALKKAEKKHQKELSLASLDDDARAKAEKDARIAELETEVKLRDANTYTDQKLLEVYRYVDGKLDGVNAAICAQNVYNATNSAAIGCINNQVAQLMSLTKVAIPITSICPEPMAKYNSWVAPTTTTT